MATMINHIIPLLASMQNVTICLEKILEKAQVDTIALVHLNTTVNFADKIYEQLANDTEYTWMRFNMARNATLKNNLMEKNLINNMFFVFTIDTVVDWKHIYNFISITKLNNRQKQIYIVNQYPTRKELVHFGNTTFYKQFYNIAVLFWNSSGHGSGIEAYSFNGFREDFIFKNPIINEQCSSNIYNQLFFEKETNFHGLNFTMFGNAEPPRIVRTVAMVNGQYEYGIGGHDVLINDVIAKHLNASAQYNLLLIIIHQLNATKYTAYRKPVDNIEEKAFNVSQIERLHWEMPLDLREYAKIYAHPAIDMITQQISYELYLETRRSKDYVFLYPHDMDNYLIVVPKNLKSQTEYSAIFKSPLTLVWLPITSFASILRYIFKRVTRTGKTHKNIIDIFLQTFGLSLGMSFNEARTSLAEKLLLWWFCWGTVLAGMLLSSSMFRGFALRMDIPTINNLKELEMSGLEIQLPLYTESVKSYFKNLHVNLKLRYRYEFAISEMISNGNTSYAYVIRERKFNFLFKNQDDMWHVLDRFGNERLSFKLRFYAGIEDRMNNVLQRCVEYGIVNYLVAKNERDLTGSRTKVAKVNSTVVKPVVVSEMHDPFLLYVLGIVLSSITLIVEVIYFRLKSTKKNY